MIKNRMKIISAAFTLLCMLFFSINAFAAQTKPVSFEEKYEYFDKMNAKYQDFDIALEHLFNKYPSLRLIDRSSNTVYVDDKGVVVEPDDISINKVDLKDLVWNESVIWDNDSQAYSYMGSWRWNAINGSNPYDNIGIYTTNSSSMPLGEVYMRGYDSNGSQTAYYSTGDGSQSGYVQRSTNVTTDDEGVGFWIDERYVVRGTVGAFISSWSAGEKVALQYDHSYTVYDIQGIGGSVDIRSGFGFNIIWQTRVVGQGPFYSNGAKAY